MHEVEPKDDITWKAMTVHAHEVKWRWCLKDEIKWKYDNARSE